MQRINTATKAVDKFGAGKHGFNDGNKAGGVSATVVDAAWADSLQEEICSVIEAAGIALNGATMYQMLLALRAAGVFATAERFDNTTKAATTAWVRRHGLQASGITTISGTVQIDISAAGGTILFNSASTIYPVLPAANSVAAGSRISMFNINTGEASLTRYDTDLIIVNSASVAGIVVGTGDTLVLESNGANGWYVVGGSSQLKYSATFASSIAAVGWQKLPNGNIRQWWGTGNIAGGANLVVSLPVTVAEVLSCQATPAGAGTTYHVDTFTTSSVKITNNGANATSFFVEAICKQ